MSVERSVLKPIKIGNVYVETPLALGPMAGVTDLPFRILCREQGAGIVYSEMISAKAILYHNRNTAELMKTAECERPIGLQLFGNDPEIMAEAAQQIEHLPFDFFDINMGCPVPKVVNNGEGSALMRNPELAAAVVSAMTRRVKKPVTVKFRRGFNEQELNAAEFAVRMEEAGAAAIAVHGRTREQFYSGEADWNCIREVKERVSVPVFGNGDVDSAEKALMLQQETGCDGIMVARATRGNPWIFSEIRAYLSGEEIPARPTLPELQGMIIRHAEMLIEQKGEYIGSREMRKHVSWYTAGMPHSASIRRRVNETESMDELRVLVESFSELSE